MLVHNVYFWLKSSLTGDQIQAFRKGVETLGQIEHAQRVYVGTPADTPERPVIDASYSVALTVLLDTLTTIVNPSRPVRSGRIDTRSKSPVL